MEQQLSSPKSSGREQPSSQGQSQFPETKAQSSMLGLPEREEALGRIRGPPSRAFQAAPAVPWACAPVPRRQRGALAADGWVPVVRREAAVLTLRLATASLRLPPQPAVQMVHRRQRRGPGRPRTLRKRPERRSPGCAGEKRGESAAGGAERPAEALCVWKGMGEGRIARLPGRGHSRNSPSSARRALPLAARGRWWTLPPPKRRRRGPGGCRGEGVRAGRRRRCHSLFSSWDGIAAADDTISGFRAALLILVAAAAALSPKVACRVGTVRRRETPQPSACGGGAGAGEGPRHVTPLFTVPGAAACVAAAPARCGASSAAPPWGPGLPHCPALPHPSLSSEDAAPPAGF